jgi:hypothetical protein
MGVVASLVQKYTEARLKTNESKEVVLEAEVNKKL